MDKKVINGDVSFPVRSYTNQEVKEFFTLDEKETLEMKRKGKIKDLEILAPGELLEKLS